MGRKVRAGDAKLLSRTARETLQPSRKPYYRLIERGTYLGYRKPQRGPGTWVVRRYIGSDRYTVLNLVTADGYPIFADDQEDANGGTVLDFWQAQDAARKHKNQLTGNAGPYTVTNAMDDYLRFAEAEGRGVHTIRDARYRVKALILPKLGETEVAALTADKLRNWRDDLVRSLPVYGPGRAKLKNIGTLPAMMRNGRDDHPLIAHGASCGPHLTMRSTMARRRPILAWRKVKPFKAVDAARVRYLSIAEAKRLINACDSNFRLLVQAALQTGARYSELARLTVADFNRDVGTVQVRQSKSGKPRHVVITDEGVALFKQLTAGRAGDEIMLTRETEQHGPLRIKSGRWWKR